MQVKFMTIPPPGEGHENVDMAVFVRIQNVNNELASGYNM